MAHLAALEKIEGGQGVAPVWALRRELKGPEHLAKFVDFPPVSATIVDSRFHRETTAG
jgi:hypothetical protein